MFVLSRLPTFLIIDAFLDYCISHNSSWDFAYIIENLRKYHAFHRYKQPPVRDRFHKTQSPDLITSSSTLSSPVAHVTLPASALFFPLLPFCRWRPVWPQLGHYFQDKTFIDFKLMWIMVYMLNAFLRRSYHAESNYP